MMKMKFSKRRAIKETLEAAKLFADLAYDELVEEMKAKDPEVFEEDFNCVEGLAIRHMEIVIKLLKENNHF